MEETARQKSALGLDGNISALLGYIIWVIALINIIIEKENRFVRFHSIQALAYHIALAVIFIALAIVQVIFTIIFGVAAAASGSSAGGAVGMLFSLLSGLIWLVVPLLALIGIIWAAIKAYQGEMYRLPIIGNMSAKWAGMD